MEEMTWSRGWSWHRAELRTEWEESCVSVCSQRKRCRDPRPSGGGQEPGPGRRWCCHGNCAAAAPPGSWPFPSAFLAGFLSHPKPIHPSEPGPRPCLPPPARPSVVLGWVFPRTPPSSPPLPLPASLCQSVGRRELGQGRTQIFNSKQISPPQAAIGELLDVA